MSRLIREPTPQEAPVIAALVQHYARRGDLLPRAEAEVRESLGHWLVSEEIGSIIGVGSLVPYSDHLVELRSLAVAPGQQGRGVGRELVEALALRARESGFAELFALTRQLGFFARCGFRAVGIERFPEKVWRDCSLCPLREQCDETPMVRLLQQPSAPYELPGFSVGGNYGER